MNKEQRERFLKLISFLKKLKRKKFSFDRIVRKYNSDTKCGTVCCAMGWTPQLFPDLVCWLENPARVMGQTDDVTLTLFADPTIWGYEYIAEALFGIPRVTAAELFAPCGQSSVHPELDNCWRNATPQAVAEMLEKYLELFHPEK